MKPISSKGKNNIVNIISNNIVHFLFEGGSSKSQHFTLLQYILEKNVKSDKKKPIGAPKFFSKNIAWGQGFIIPIINVIKQSTKNIALIIEIKFNILKRVIL